MKAFNFDLQRFSLTFEYTSGIKTFEDPGLIEDTAYYYVYQYYPATTWNDYFEFQNYKVIELTAENYYHYYPETIREAVSVGCINEFAAAWLSLHGWQYFQTVPGATVSGDYRILRGGNENYHALSNYQADYVQMYGRHDGAVLKNEYGNYVLLFGGEDDDYIENVYGNNATIDAGNGNDYIDSWGDSVSIDGGADNDSIISYTNNNAVTIDGGANDDYIYSPGKNAKLIGGDGNDYIRNYGSSVTINGGKGNDSIYNYSWYGDGAHNISIDGGAGDDTILNWDGSNVTIDGGDGNDDIGNIGSNVTIDGNAGNDRIDNHGSSVTIDGGDGNDDIGNYGLSNVTIDGSAGNDHIDNYGSSVTIDGGEGNDVINNYKIAYVDGNLVNGGGGDRVSINGGAGNDTIYNGIFEGRLQSESSNGVTHYTYTEEIKKSGGSEVTIETGKNDDYIFNLDGSNISIKAGDGKNTVKSGYVEGHVETKEILLLLTPTMVNSFVVDTQISGGSDITIETGDNDDEIEIYGGSNISIKTGNGDNLVSLGGNISSVQIELGSGEDTLMAYVGNHDSFNTEEDINGNFRQKREPENMGGNNITVNGGTGKNVISIGSSWRYITINGGNKSDAIFNEGNIALIQGNDGNDYIRNKSDYAILFGDADGDIIENFGNNAYIQGDDGEKGRTSADYIYTDRGTDVTIDAGKDDDIIDAYNDVRASINGGAGNDYIALQRMTAKDANDLAVNYLKDLPKSIFEDLVKKLTIASSVQKKIINEAFGEGLEQFDGAVGLVRSFVGYFNLFKPYYDKLSAESTVQGGLGNDLIISDGVAPRVFEYRNNDGNDTIYYFNVNKALKDNLGIENQSLFLSTLHITNTLVDKVEVDDTDVIVKVGSGSIKLVEGTNKKFKLRESNGNATIRAYGKDSETGELICSIFGSESGDTIKDTINAENTRYAIYGDSGADSLVGNNKNDTLWGGNEDDTMHSAGEDTLRGEGGNDFLYAANNSLLDGGADDDTIYSGKTISYPDPQGYVPVNGNKNTVYGGTGDDEIHNYGNETSIEGGANNDYIYNHGENRLIEQRLILGGYAVTIVGGTGNDYISNSGDRVLFKYNSGDGNDFIVGFNETSTLQIGDGTGTYSKTTSEDGFDIIITVGNGTITLKDVAFLLKTVNIEGICTDKEKELPPGVEIEGDVLKFSKLFTNDKFDVNDLSFPVKNIDVSELEHGVEIIGNSSIDKFTGSNKADVFYTEPPATQNPSNAKNNIVSSNDLLSSNDLFSDSAKAENQIMTVSAEGGDDTIYASGEKTKLYVYNAGDSNDVIYNFSATDTLSITSGSYSTAQSGSDIIVSVGTGSIKLMNAASLSNVNIDGKKSESVWTLNGTTATYGNGNETLITVNGVKSPDGLNLNDKIVTVSKDSVNKSNITISDGYTLALESDIKPSKNVSAHFSGLTYKSASNSAGYSLSNDKKSIDYTPPVAETDLFTLTNVKNTDSINVDTAKKTVTLKAGNLTGKNVSLTGDYSLALSGVNPSTSTAAHFSGLTYKSASNSEGYSVSADKKSVTYTSAVAESDLFSLTNVKNTDSINVDTAKKTVTLNAGNLTGKNVSITGDYSLKLGNDVPTSTTKTAGSFTKFASGTATFKTSSFSDFYSLKNNQVTYTAPSGGKTISIKNLKSSATLDKVKAGITISEQKNGSYKITFKSFDLLTTKSPTISATDVTYTVALDKSLNPSALAPDWKVSGTNASLKSDTSAGYTVSDNKVLYSKKVIGSPQLVLSGLVKNSSLSTPIKKVATLDTKVLGNNASLKSNAGSYTIKLTGNMSKKTFTASANADSLNIAANNAAVFGGAGNDSFTVSGSKVTLTGGKGNDSFKLSGKNPVLIYNTGDGNDTVNFVSGMQFSLSGSTQIKTLGKSGSDLVLGFGKNSSVKVTGAKSSDTLKVSDASGSVTLVAGKFDLADSLTFNSKNSSVTVAKNFFGSLAPSDDIYLGGSKLSKVATINASNVTSEITISGNDKANTIFAGKNNDCILGGNGNDSIVGNAGNDKLYGQNGNDSLWDGKGNDSLWGGDGNDVFIYSAGNDVIADFTASQDKIKIASGKISKSSLTGSDVIFTIGKGSLTVKNAKGKSISLLDSTGKASTTVVGAQTFTNSNKANVTISTDMGVVDASKRTKSVQITGNALANSISGGSKNDSIYGGAGNDSILGNAGNDKLFGDAGNDILKGGKGNDSLWGGKGNDSLWGDAGSDTFIYESGDGKDVIFGFENNDLLQITGTFSGTYNKSKKEVYFKVGSTASAITLKDFSSTSTFNINCTNYTISGSKLVKK